MRFVATVATSSRLKVFANCVNFRREQHIFLEESTHTISDFALNLQLIFSTTDALVVVTV